MDQANSDMDINGIHEGIAQLIGAVIGTAIKPENTYRLASGRMNRPEDRGGEDVEWLNSENGKFWLTLADQVGINTTVIRQIANNPKAYGYEGIGQGNWDVYSNIIELRRTMLDDAPFDNEPNDNELAKLEIDIENEQDSILTMELGV